MIGFNIDVFLVGAAAAAIGILGFAIYISNPRSITNRTFIVFAILTIFWSVANFFQYNPSGVFVGIWVVRSITFLGCWHALAFFQLCYVFPESEFKIPRWYKEFLVPATALISLLTLSPLVFSRVLTASANGVITSIEDGPGIALFGLLTLGLIVASATLLIRGTMRRKGIERTQMALMTIGAGITFLCIVVFNIILPSLFNIAGFISYSAIFLAPLVAFTAYAILQHRLFNVKVGVTAALVFLLAALVFIEVLFSTGLVFVLVRIGILVLVLIIGVTLINSVQKEVEQREIIEHLSEEKSEFMTFASHEIRNPITAMRGYASLISDGTTGETSPQVKEAADRILVTGNDVLHLITEYLAKSKLELGKMSYSNDVFDLSAAVLAVADGYKPHVKQKGLMLMNDIDPGENILIRADQARVKEVVGNLIDNSLKYTPHGSITVSVHRHGVHARIVISDTGVGIPAEVLPHLFGKFSRADAQKVNLLGTGIGLYLAKAITTGMGGRIWAESDGKGKGSRFIMEFPLATA